MKKLNSDTEPDLICLGCPHSSANEIKKIAALLKDKKINENLQFWIFTSEKVRNEIETDGYEAEIEKAGGKIITDTCMVVAPLEDLGYKCMLTNSAKAAHYTRSLCKIESRLDSLKNIIKFALK